MFKQIDKVFQMKSIKEKLNNEKFTKNYIEQFNSIINNNNTLCLYKKENKICVRMFDPTYLYKPGYEIGFINYLKENSAKNITFEHNKIYIDDETPPITIVCFEKDNS